MHRREHHGVRHGALARPQSRGLVHSKQADVEAELVVDELQVHHSRHPVAELAHVAAKEHRYPRLEHTYARVFEGLHLDVDVRDPAATYDVAQSIHRQQAQGRVARVMHKGYQTRDHRAGHPEVGRPNIVGEGERVGLDLLGLAVLVQELPREFLRG